MAVADGRDAGHVRCAFGVGDANRKAIVDGRPFRVAVCEEVFGVSGDDVVVADRCADLADSLCMIGGILATRLIYRHPTKKAMKQDEKGSTNCFHRLQTRISSAWKFRGVSVEFWRGGEQRAGPVGERSGEQREEQDARRCPWRSGR